MAQKKKLAVLLDCRWLTRTVSVQLNLATVIVVCQTSTLHSGHRTYEVAFEFSSTFDFHEICYIDSHKKKPRRGETFWNTREIVRLYPNSKSTSFWPHQCALSTDYVVVVMIMRLMGWDRGPYRPCAAAAPETNAAYIFDFSVRLCSGDQASERVALGGHVRRRRRRRL